MVMQPTKITPFVSLLMVILCLALPTAKAATASLYDVEIAVADESAEARWGAFVQGMREVFIRIAGDSIILDKMKQPQPTPYVKQYTYLPIETPSEAADGEVKNYRLNIQFNGSLMEKYLIDNGMPVWGDHRPDVLIWLAVNDGRNEYVLRSADHSIIKSTVDEAMKRRGVPDLWPLYDRRDKKILSVADIRGGFKDPVSDASKRYTSGPALSGSLMWNGKQWQSSWSLMMDGSSQLWSLVDSDYDRLINKAVDQAADVLGSALAVHDFDNEQKLASLKLDVDSVTSVDSYRRVENYLRSIVSVASVMPLTVDGQSVLFGLKIRSDERDFLNLLKHDAELIETRAPAQVQPVSDEVVVDKTVSTDAGSADTAPVAGSEVTSVRDLQPDPVITHYYRLAK